jgi:ribose transport system substrate-binding protein
MTPTMTRVLKAALLSATILAAGAALAEDPIHSELTGNDVVVGAAKDALIQVIQPGVHPYPAAGDEGFKQEGAALGLTNIQITQSNWDPAAEVANVQNAIAKGAAAIIIQAVSSEGVVPAIEAANAAGICTVAFVTQPGQSQDTVYPGMKAYVGWNEFEGGRIAGAALAEAMGGSGNVVIIQGQLQSAGARARQEGAESIWAEKYPGITVLAARPADYDSAKARQVMQDFAQRYGEQIQGILAITNNMGTAAADALVGTPLQGTPIVSYGGQQQFIDYIKQGLTYGTTPFAPLAEAAQALDLAVACINGDKTPVFFNETDLPPVRALKDHNYMIDATSLDLYQAQW